MKRLLLSLLALPLCWGQPVITGNRVDSTHAGATAPLKLVAVLPTGITPQISCRVGDMVELTSVIPWQIYYNSTNGVCTWIAQGGSGGSGGGNSYITGATASPMTILATTHHQGINADVFCFAGPVIAASATGRQVYCDYTKDQNGNVTINWGGSTVGSIQIFSSGPGPAGDPGPAGPAGTPGIISQTLANNVPQVPRPKLGFVGGANVTITPSDNGIDTTTITISATGGGGGGTPGGTNGQIQFNNTGTFGGFTMGGDATLNTGTGVIIVNRTNGLTFAPSATTDTTNAGNISSGILSVLRGGSGVGTISGIIRGNGTSAFSAANASNVVALFSGCSGIQGLGADGACHNFSGGGSGIVQVQANSVPLTFRPNLNVAAGVNVTITPTDNGVDTTTLTIASSGGSGSGTPYVINATTSPQTILQSTHLQGINPAVQCWDGAVSSGATTGTQTGCSVTKNNLGDVTVYWSGSATASIEVMAAGPGPQGPAGPGGSGTVTSVAIALPGSVFSISGSPVTVTGTLTGTFVTQSANTFFRGPTSGGSATPSFGILVAADIPNNAANTSGNAGTATALASTPTLCSAGNAPLGILANGNATGCQALSGSGTVTSVGLSMPSIFTVSGSPVTSSGTLTAVLANAPANFVFAGPVLGPSAGVPTFRAISFNDLPNILMVMNTPFTTASLSAGVPGVRGVVQSDLSGDVFTSGTLVTTLVNVSSTFGTCGDSTHVCQVVTNAKGLVTSQSAVAISGGGGGTPGGSSGQLQFNNGGAFGGVTMAGDASFNAFTGGLTLTSVNGSPGACGNSTNWCIPTTNAKGLVTSQTTTPIPIISTDIRLYGAVCNGSDQHSAVQSALAAGKTNLYIPAGCTWVLPTGAWTYGSTTVAGNSIPPGLTIYGENWVTSIIQTSSPSSVDMQMGGGTNVYAMNLKSHACAPWDQNSQSFISGIDCPNQIYTNGSQVYSGTVTASGTSVTWATGTKFNCRTSEGSSWVGRSIVVNGTVYSVTAVGGCSGTITTTLTVNTSIFSCGGGCVYSFPDNYPFVSTGYQPYTFDLNGPGDFAGIQAKSHGAGDAFFAQVDSTNGTGLRVGLQQNGHIGVLVQKFNGGIAYSIIDDALFGTSGTGTGYDYFTQTKVSGPFFSATQTSVTYSGDAFTLDLAAGSGSCTGRFLKFTSNLSSKFSVDCSGNTALNQLTINDSSSIFLFGAIPSSGSGSGGYLCRDSSTGRIYQKATCP